MVRGSVRGFRFGWKASGTVALLAAVVASPLAAQIRSRTRRETNANRRARIAREIAETYAHRNEFSGGGGFLRFRSGEFLQKNNEITFYANETYFLNPKLGILGDVHGAFGNAKLGNNAPNLQNPQISQYTFTAGPVYRFYRGRKISGSVFGTGGVALGNFAGGIKGFSPDYVGLWSTTLRPAFTAGVNLDYNFFPNLAGRITPTYIGTTFDGAPQPSGVQTVHGSVQNNLGINFGIVYRFGRLR